MTTDPILFLSNEDGVSEITKSIFTPTINKIAEKAKM
jgi:hypothetical protein